MKKTLFALTLILLVAVWLRLYKLPETYQFLGDQGRDAIVMSEMLRGQRMQLTGPTMSVGGFHLGPFFYYLTAPSLLLSQFDPLGPAVFQALLGVLTVLMLYLCVSQYSSTQAGLIAALLAAVDPTLVHFSRFSWNPNAVPLFTVFALYAFLQYRKTQQLKWLLICGVVFFFLIQLHYVTLLLLVPVLLQWWMFKKKKKHLPWKKLFLFFIPVALAVIPLIYELFTKGIPDFSKTISSQETGPQLHAHYVLFVFPLVYAAFGHMFVQAERLLKQQRFILWSTLITISLLFLSKAAYLDPPLLSQTPAARTLAVATVIQYSNGKPFQVAVLSNTSSDDPYRYLLSLQKAPVVLGIEGADQLFVICEDVAECKTYGNPHFEIASFAVKHLKKPQLEQTLLTEPVLIKRVSLLY
ncbi:glycosyltransferase family 39 protein [Candidatus Woesebacteria bacterium]|nr:glycosyltransferase family 39 protein [Candidatus Woesebacteria bacterium]